MFKKIVIEWTDIRVNVISGKLIEAEGILRVLKGPSVQTMMTVKSSRITVTDNSVRRSQLDGLPMMLNDKEGGMLDAILNGFRSGISGMTDPSIHVWEGKVVDTESQLLLGSLKGIANASNRAIGLSEFLSELEEDLAPLVELWQSAKAAYDDATDEAEGIAA